MKGVWTVGRVVLLGVCSLLANRVVAGDTFNANYDALLATDKASVASGLLDQARADAITDKYNTLFGSIQNIRALKSLSDDDLQMAFRAAVMVAYYDPRMKTVNDAKLDLHELELRKSASGENVLEMYKTLVMARDFESAKALAEKDHSEGMEALPALTGAPIRLDGRPNLYVVSSNLNALQREPVDLTGDHIVVVGHPLCHFTLHAAQDIDADPQLSDAFKKHSIWVAPPSYTFDVLLFQKWNASHPSEALGIAYKKSDWPMIDSWSTPTFYFMHNGKVVIKLIGWPIYNGGRPALIRALKAMGFLNSYIPPTIKK